MERRNRDWSLTDGLTAGLGGPKMGVFFERCQRSVPWDQLGNSIRTLFDDSKPGNGGRPHWPLVTMIKCLMLQKWFNLSDPQLEEMLKDRLSFRRFVGLSLEDDTPDETTFVVFRRRLRETGHDRTLFATTTEILKGQGLIVSEGTLVDATIIGAPRGRTKADGTSTRDPEASYTKKSGQIRHGYKGHLATDRRGVIKDFRFTTAKTHESQHMDEMIEDETVAVFADSAYMDQRREERLTRRGVYYGIVKRRGRGQPELSFAQKFINRSCSVIRAVVEHPFAWMKNMGYGRARYRGLIRNALDFALMATAYNWKRSFSLVP